MNFLGRIKQAFVPLADEDVANKKYVDDLAAALGARIDGIGTAPPDTTPPTVSISASKTSASPGESVTFTVTASDDVGIASTAFAFNGTAYSLNSSNQVTVTMPSTAGTYTAQCTVTDAAGNSETATVSVSVQTTPTYTVTFSMNGGFRSGGGELIQLVPQGESAIPPGAYRSGHTFAGWDKAYTNVQANITVTALWSSSGGGGMGTGSGF